MLALKEMLKSALYEIQLAHHQEFQGTNIISRNDPKQRDHGTKLKTTMKLPKGESHI